MKNELNKEKFASFSLKYILKIKLTTFFLIVFLFNLQAKEPYAQKTKVTINLENVSIEDVLNKIESLTEYNFFFNYNDFNYEKKVSINSKIESVSSILKRLFKGSDISINVIDKQIVLFRKQTSENKQNLNNETSILEEFTVSGTVKDSNGQTISGANVYEKGTEIGTQTDADGKFSLEVANENAILVVSFIGFLTQEVNVNNQTEISITLQDDVASLEEVVLVGYGKQKKVNLTGAVGTVDKESMENRSQTNVSNLLTGEISGLTVIQRAGQPGKDQGTINIRGIGTFGNTDPMVIVDGIESSLSRVHPQDIENISILKDASASAIYGVRGANGVILITTKNGRSGQMFVDYSVSTGFSEATRVPVYLGSADQARLENEANANDGSAPKWTAEDIAGFEAGTDLDKYPNTNWENLLFKSAAFFQDHTFNISNGNEKGNYFVSLGYTSRDGIIQNVDYKRFASRININQTLAKKLDMEFRLSYIKDDINEPSRGMNSIIQKTFRQPSYLANKYSDGSWGVYLAEHNSVREAEEGGVTNNDDNYITGIIGLNYEILPDLNLKGKVAFNNDYFYVKSFQKYLEYFDFSSKNRITEQRSTISNEFINQQRSTLQAIAEYSKTINNHDLKLLSGFSQEYWKKENFISGRRNLPKSNELESIDASDVSTQFTSGSPTDYAIRSVFGRFNYTFKSKYMLEASLRYDGSSRFAPDLRFELFPSVSAGWRVSEESFFNFNFIEELKLRGSYGKLGNQEVTGGNYPYQPTFSYGTGIFGKSAQITAVENSQLSNELLTWEVSTIYNIGLDASFLKGKLEFTVEYFNKDTDDILLSLPVAAVVGASPPLQNAGNVNNNGIELSLGYRNFVGDIEYFFSGNFSHIRNKITDLKGTDAPGRSVGDPINNIYGMVAEGIFRNEAEIAAAPVQASGAVPGDIRYKDIAGPNGSGPDGKIDDNDRMSIGNYFPEITYAFKLGGAYKNFDLSMNFQGVAKVDGYLENEAAYHLYNGGKALPKHLDRFHITDNPNGSYPRLTIAARAKNEVRSTFWLQDASYLRLRNMQIGYSFKDVLLEKIGIEKLRVYVSADNLFTITKFEGFDPEAAIGRGNFHPPMRTFLLGLNVSI